MLLLHWWLRRRRRLPHLRRRLGLLSGTPVHCGRHVPLPIYPLLLRRLSCTHGRAAPRLWLGGGLGGLPALCPRRRGGWQVSAVMPLLPQISRLLQLLLLPPPVSDVVKRRQVVICGQRGSAHGQEEG